MTLPENTHLWIGLELFPSRNTLLRGGLVWFVVVKGTYIYNYTGPMEKDSQISESASDAVTVTAALFCLNIFSPAKKWCLPPHLCLPPLLLLLPLFLEVLLF